MNGENFEHWMSTQLLPNLEEPSVIVMNNASYHNVHIEKPPIQSWRKDEIIAWLQEKLIHFAEGSFKAELLNLNIANMSSKKRYTIS
jgi:ABC-type Zn2+ transport system substrate-binding protein/surface adhesin